MEKQWCVVLVAKDGSISWGAICSSPSDGRCYVRFKEELTADAVVDLYIRLGTHRCVQKIEMDVDESKFGEKEK